MKLIIIIKSKIILSNIKINSILILKLMGNRFWQKCTDMQIPILRNSSDMEILNVNHPRLLKYLLESLIRWKFGAILDEILLNMSLKLMYLNTSTNL